MKIYKIKVSAYKDHSKRGSGDRNYWHDVDYFLKPESAEKCLERCQDESPNYYYEVEEIDVDEN